MTTDGRRGRDHLPDEPDALAWDTADLSPGRRPGPAMRALNALVPGVRLVRDQVEPYAEAWRRANAEALVGTGRRWVVLGDSMSQGVGGSAHDAGWVGQLATRLRSDGHDLDVVNLSATGARTTDLLERQLPVLERLPPATGDTGPALVTVMIGSNDLFGGRGAGTRLPAAMAALVDRLPRGSVITTLPQPARAARLANIPIERAGAAGHLRVVDLRTSGPTSWRGRLASDWFHPNDLGYTGLADAMEPAVRDALRAG